MAANESGVLDLEFTRRNLRAFLTINAISTALSLLRKAFRGVKQSLFKKQRRLTSSNELVRLLVMKPAKGKEISLFEAKTHLSEIIKKVERGQSFRITKRGKPVAELHPLKPEKLPLTRGCAKTPGFWMADDFDDPLPDMQEYME